MRPVPGSITRSRSLHSVVGPSRLSIPDVDLYASTAAQERLKHCQDKKHWQGKMGCSGTHTIL